MSSHALDKTYEAVERQLGAMGADLFEIGALHLSGKRLTNHRAEGLPTSEDGS